MKQEFLKYGPSGKLLVFFGGWGSGPELFREAPVPDGWDLMLCYDYRDVAFDASPIAGYREVRVLAWSMGVFVASLAMTESAGVPVPRGERIDATAVCGTLYPSDDARGIPEAVFRATCENMSDSVLAKFRRRMCGKSLNDFLSNLPDRSSEELAEELRKIYETVRTADREESVLCWKKAVCCTGDLIFPYASQVAAWSENPGTDIVTCDAPHYDRILFERMIWEACP